MKNIRENYQKSGPEAILSQNPGERSPEGKTGKNLVQKYHNSKVPVIRLLHIDDEPAILEISRLILQNNGGFEVTTLQDSQKALEINPEEYDIIVSDYEMPDVSGLDILQHLRSRGVTTPFILMTGRGNDSVILEALKNGAASYLQKTANPKAMFAELIAVAQKEMQLVNQKKRSFGTVSQPIDRTFFNALPEPAFAVDTDARIIAWNLAMEEMTGVSQANITGFGWDVYSRLFGEVSRNMTVHGLLAQDPSLLENYDLTLCTNSVITGKITIQTTDGDMKTYWEKSALIKGEDGKVEGAIVLMRDLTRRSSIILQNKLIREQLSSIADSMISFGPDFTENIKKILSLACRFCGSVSAGYYQSIRQSRDTLILYQTPNQHPGEQTILAALSEKKEGMMNQASDPWFFRTYQVGREEGSGIILVYQAVEEVSGCDAFIRLLIGAIGAEERRFQAYQEMRRSDFKYRMLFDHAPVPLFEQDYSGVYRKLKEWECADENLENRFQPGSPVVAELMKEVRLVSMNKASQQLLGTRQSSPAYSMKILGSAPHARKLFLQACTCMNEKKNHFSASDYLILPDQKRKDILLNWVNPEKTDNYQSVLVSMVDLTAQKRVEESLKQANKKLHTVSMITRHDILNLMTALLGLLDIIRSDSHEQEIRSQASAGLQICRRITDIISFMKDYEQLGMSEPSWSDISSLIQSEKLSKGFPHITFSMEIEPAVLLTDVLMPLVIWNLVDNAVRHGTSVSRIMFKGIRQAGGYYLIVTDNGSGIPSAHKEEIFTRGFGKNTGLGLFLVREILALTSIEIHEEGTEGEGARFVIWVPSNSCRHQE